MSALKPHEFWRMLAAHDWGYRNGSHESFRRGQDNLARLTRIASGEERREEMMTEFSAYHAGKRLHLPPYRGLLLVEIHDGKNHWEIQTETKWLSRHASIWSALDEIDLYMDQIPETAQVIQLSEYREKRR